MLFFYLVNFLDFLGIRFIRLSLVCFDAVFFKKVVFLLLTCGCGCMSRIHREMLTEKNKGNPMSRSFVECAIALRTKEVRKRKRCYPVKVVARSTIGAA
jgi:hypothetical protein